MDQPAAAAGMMEGVRVLVVDDERGLTRALQRGLAAEGFAVDCANDGETGLSLATHGDYDAIVLDVMLPRRNGYDVVAALRKRKVWTPVIMLSAKDGEHDVADALDLGADDYLTKPFSFVVLVARLRALVRRPSEARPAVLTIGAIELNPSTRVVTRNAQVVELTAREVALLEYLMRHADRVVGKVELRDHVWDGDGEDLNVVEVYVGYLRRKLGRDSVSTVRGAGYRVVG
ncbi:MAG: response regulator transcription factor [Arachnia sp.]